MQEVQLLLADQIVYVEWTNPDSLVIDFLNAEPERKTFWITVTLK